MNRMKSRQSFINFYGEEILFNEKDKKEVFNKIHNPQKTTGRKPKSTFKWGAIFAMAAVPLVLVLIFLSSDGSFTEKPEKQIKSAELKPAPQVENNLHWDAGLQKVRKEGQFQQINQTLEDGGVEATIYEAMYDGTRIGIVYGINHNEQPIKPEDNFATEKLVIGGEIFTGYSGIGRLTGEKDKHYLEYHLAEDLPDEFELGYDLTLSGNPKKEWHFKIPLKKIEGLYKDVKPLESVTSKDLTLKVEEAKFTPSSTNLKISVTGPEGHLKKGNSYLFGITDDKGREIGRLFSAASGGTGLDNNMFEDSFNEYYEPVSKLPKTLTIQPYLVGDRGMQNEMVEESLNQKLPIRIEKGQNSSMIIKKMEQYENQLWIHYTLDGPQSWWMPLRLKQAGSDEEIPLINRINKEDVRIDIFETDLSPEDLIAITPKNNVIKLDDLKLKIDVK